MQMATSPPRKIKSTHQSSDTLSISFDLASSIPFLYQQIALSKKRTYELLRAQQQTACLSKKPCFAAINGATANRGTEQCCLDLHAMALQAGVHFKN